MIIRDLTLRSAASFGSFHLIRLLYDEYMFYLVEDRVARSLGQSPVSVIGLGRMSNFEDGSDFAAGIKMNGVAAAAADGDDEDEVVDEEVDEEDIEEEEEEEVETKPVMVGNHISSSSAGNGEFRS